MTELIGDIVITCTGGPNLVPGALVPTTNITISLGTAVTSRLLTGSVSEALLMIDEPGSALNYPTGLATPGQTLCSTPTVGAGPGGCVQYVGAATIPGGTCSGTVQATGNCSVAGTGTQYTMFQGTVSGNQVVFNGIPVLPPVTGGYSRIFRITNVRANAAALGAGALSGTTQLLASIAVSNTAALPLTSSVMIAGFIQTGLTTAVRNAANDGSLGTFNINQCDSKTLGALATLRFTENFASSTKTRVAGTSAYTGQSSAPTLQNVPGNIYSSESGFYYPSAYGTGGFAGLSDYGSRLKATFTNVPTGIRLFVGTTNFNSTLATLTTGGNTSTTTFAQLVISETAGDSNGFAPVASYTTSTGGVYLAEVSLVNGAGTAVWEVINSNPNATDVYNFPVYYTFTGTPSSNTPPPGTGSVALSYAPTPTGGAFTATSGAAASASLSVPRFADAASGTSLMTVIICQSVLLYPFVTNAPGFDTGLAIANTTSDPFGTKAQTGACTMKWYTGTTNPADTTTGSIATGTVWTSLASTQAAGFTGYMIAICNFQLAHGFAFITDVGARNLAMGYLAEVLPGGTSARPYSTGALVNENYGLTN